MAITAPTPMMMPSIVKKARILLRAKARRAMRNVMNHIMAPPDGKSQISVLQMRDSRF
jgi:S-adenosylmethionine synthetase